LDPSSNGRAHFYELLGFCPARFAVQQTAENHLQHGDEDKIEHRREQHSTHDGGTHRAAAERARAGSKNQGQHAEDERERRHEDGGRGVERDGVLGPGRKLLRQLGEHRLGATINVESIRVGKLLHADAHGFMSGELEPAAIVLRAYLRVADVAQLDQALRGGLDDQVVEFPGAGESPLDADGI